MSSSYFAPVALQILRKFEWDLPQESELISFCRPEWQRRKKKLDQQGKIAPAALQPRRNLSQAIRNRNGEIFTFTLRIPS